MARVCIFSAQYLPSSYGVEKYTFNIAKEMSKRGIEVTIVTSDLYGEPRRERAGNLTIYRLPSYGAMKNRLPVILYNRAFRSNVKTICRLDYDLCIIQTRFYPLSLLGATIGKKIAKKTILIEHGTSHIEMGSSFWKKMGELYEHVITFFIKKKVEHFYGVSKDCNEWLKHFGIEAEGVLYNAINEEEIEGIKKNDIREKLNISKEHLLIVFTGRLIKEKGVMQLKEAFRRIQKRYSKVSLVMAGDGPLIKELDQPHIDNLYLTGRVPFKEVISLLKESDIFCFPSVYAEGLPTSLLEAAICKSCLISTKCGGATEIIPDREYGILIENNTSEKIEEALEVAIKNEEYRKKMTDNIYKRVKEKFIWSKITDRIQEEFL